MAIKIFEWLMSWFRHTGGFSKGSDMLLRDDEIPVVLKKGSEQ